MIWRVIPYGIEGPANNMAIDEAIFHFYRNNLVPPTLRFYGWNPPTLSLGYFQDLGREVNLSNLTVKGFGLVRRSTGGRAVLHHHELTYSVVAGTKDGLPDSLIDCYLYISKALIIAFKNLGIYVKLHQSPATKHFTSGACFESPSWHELKVGGRKLVGSAQLRRDHSFLQHGSILLKFNAEDLSALLKSSTNDISNNLAERLRGQVISLDDLGIRIDPESLARQIVAGFSELYDIMFEESTLSDPEKKLAKELVETKYATKDWNYTRGSHVSKFGGADL